jgi:maleate isomerase
MSRAAADARTYAEIAVDRRVRLGMLTPSSNTVLEAVCAAMLAESPEVSAHYSRFRVTEIRASEAADAQFAGETMLAAAMLLADARMHAICWNGTSASWLGLGRDRDLCAAITRATRTPAISATLATYDVLKRAGARRLGLVTPYLDEVQAKIVDQFARQGFDVSAERHLGLADNFAFAEVPARDVAEMIRAVADQGCDAALVLCTNFCGAPVAAALEAETGVLVIDSVAASVWGALRAAGLSTAPLHGWGRMFQDFD